MISFSIVSEEDERRSHHESLCLVYEMTNAGRVDMGDFQLLKVLGTGGKDLFFPLSGDFSDHWL